MENHVTTISIKVEFWPGRVVRKVDNAIQWIAIYSVDSVIQPMNNWGQEATRPLTTPPLPLMGCLPITCYPSEFCKLSLGAAHMDAVRVNRLFPKLDGKQSIL